MTPSELKAEQDAADKAFFEGNEPEDDQSTYVDYIDMPLSAAVPFEKDLQDLGAKDHLQECRI